MVYHRIIITLDAISVPISVQHRLVFINLLEVQEISDAIAMHQIFWYISQTVPSINIIYQVPVIPPICSWLWSVTQDISWFNCIISFCVARICIQVSQLIWIWQQFPKSEDMIFFIYFVFLESCEYMCWRLSHRKSGHEYLVKSDWNWELLALDSGANTILSLVGSSVACAENKVFKKFWAGVKKQVYLTETRSKKNIQV